MSVAEGGRRSRAGFAGAVVVVVSEGGGRFVSMGFGFDFALGLGFRGREYFVVMRVVVG